MLEYCLKKKKTPSACVLVFSPFADVLDGSKSLTALFSESFYEW